MFICMFMCKVCRFSFHKCILTTTVKVRMNVLGTAWPVTFLSCFEKLVAQSLCSGQCRESQLPFRVFWQWLIHSLLFEWEIELPFQVKESRCNISPLCATERVSKHFSVYPYLKWPGVSTLSLCMLSFSPILTQK